MKLNLKLHQHTLNLPIIQGGMGIGVSLGNLAGAVMQQGCMGVISAAQPGYKEADFYKNTFNANIRALNREIAKARQIGQGKGMLGVNVMVAARRYKEYIKAIGLMDIDCIISGAGLPLDLPELVDNKNILLAPIVSSRKAAELICKVWDKRHQRVPDFIVIEGSLAGGHLGFKKEDLINETCESLDDILVQVKEMIGYYEQKYERKIHIFVAGGIYTGADITHYLKNGADGVQIGTRFIATYECDAHPSFKQSFINCNPEDIKLTKSPSGFPGRARSTPFMEMVNKRQENIKVEKCVACLIPCNPSDTPYCITDALIQSVSGRVEQGLVFTGTNGYRIDKIVSVNELVNQLKDEMVQAYEK
jgi:nitronate monooxygenase